MPTRQPTAAISAIEDPLLKVYADAWEHIQQLQAAIAADPVKWRQRKKLAEVQRSIENRMQELDGAAKDWVKSELVRPYAMGAAAGAVELEQSAAAVWSQLPEDSIRRIATDTLSDLLKSTRHVRRTTKALIRTIAKDEILKKLVIGDTAQAAGRRVEQILKSKGISAITYKDGSRHGLQEYTQMLVRTKTAEAYNLGSLEAQESLGIDFWEVFDGAGCGWRFHKDKQALGKIVTKEDAAKHPIAHPQCRRAFGARPDIKNAGEADAASPHVAPSQTAADRAADKTRSRERLARRYRARQKTAPRPAGTVRKTSKPSLTAARRGAAVIPITRRPRRKS